LSKAKPAAQALQTEIVSGRKLPIRKSSKNLHSSVNNFFGQYFCKGFEVIVKFAFFRKHIERILEDIF
jgi:hypothetical protein